MTRLTLIAQAAPSSDDASRFSTHVPPAPKNLERARKLAPNLSVNGPVFSAPEPGARDTAAALDLDPEPVHPLRAPEFGSWAGLSFMDVSEADPTRFGRWLTDPTVAPPEGESAVALVDRVSAWIDAQVGTPTLTIVAHPMVIRAAVVHAAAAPPASWFRFEIGFLSRTVLTHAGRFWRVQQVNGPL